MHPIRHPAPRAFHVQDEFRPLVDRPHIDRPAGFDQDRIAGIAQTSNQRKHLRLRERLAAGHFDQLTAKLQHLRQNRLDGERRPAVKAIVGIAPGTTERTTREPNEDAGLPRIRRLSLDTVKDLRYPERLFLGLWDGIHRQDTTGQPLRRATRPMPRIGFTTVGCPTAVKTA